MISNFKIKKCQKNTPKNQIYDKLKKEAIMKIEKIKVGELQCNCYLLEKENNYLLIDPGAEYEKICSFINNKNIVGILITHNHFDHIGILNQLIQDDSYPIYQYSNLKEGPLAIENFYLEVISTPGHSPDSLTFYFPEEKIMFTGDFLFFHTIGRCDLVGGNEDQMQKSIQKIKQYSSDITIYPGHGPQTTLQEEIIHNPYF